MNDKIAAIVVNLNSVVNRLEWIREQNYDDPEAVDLIVDVAEWVCEIDAAVEAIEKSLAPALRGRFPKPSPNERGVGTHPNNSTGDGGVGTQFGDSPSDKGVGTQFGDSPSDKEEGTHPLIPSQEGKNNLS